MLDSYLPPALIHPTNVPVLVLSANDENRGIDQSYLWDNLRGPRFAVNFQGAEHLTPSDAVWLARGAVKTGTMGPDQVVTALRQYIAAFLDAALRDYPVDPMLSGPSPAYPDVVVAEPGKPLFGYTNGHPAPANGLEGR